jgi:hypothetical protein
MTMFISQSMGYVDTGGGNGSITVPAPPSGKTLYYQIVPLVDLGKDLGKKPGVTLSGRNLSWAYSFYTGGGWGYFAANCRIYYGYY